MTTDVRSRIAPDNALVIYPRDFGSEVGPGELEALFLEFTSRHSDSQWQFELGPDGEIIAMGPVSHPGGFHENDAATDLRIWSREFGGESTGSNAFYRMPVTGGVSGSRRSLGFAPKAGCPPSGFRRAHSGMS